MASLSQVVSLIVLHSMFSSTIASDPSQLQDFCVMDKNSTVFVNGFVWKDPKKVTAVDFFFPGLNKPGNTNNWQGSNMTMINVNQIPGLNTLGISLVCIDYGPFRLNPPHTHPRATEIVTVIKGSLFIRFVTNNPNNTFISKTLVKGDVFVFPEGLIHFQQNVDSTDAVVIAALSSQNPGVITIANAMFGSKPPITDLVLMRAFQVDQVVIDKLEAPFMPS